MKWSAIPAIIERILPGWWTMSSEATENHSTTMEQAADLLNVPQDYLVGLLDAGEIPYSGHDQFRRIKTDDLLDFKRERDKSRADTLDVLFAADADLI